MVHCPKPRSNNMEAHQLSFLGLYNKADALYGQLLGDGVIIQTDFQINNTNVPPPINFALFRVFIVQRGSGMLETPRRHLEVF